MIELVDIMNEFKWKRVDDKLVGIINEKVKDYGVVKNKTL